MSHRDFLQEDIEMLCNGQHGDWGELEGSTIFVTGATGLIGFALVRTLLQFGKTLYNAPKVIALVRNMEKADMMYADVPRKNLDFLVSDITQPFNVPEAVDYIIHGASETSSIAFVRNPVETIKTGLDGTRNMLEMAKAKEVKGFVYLSSMEVYGAPETDEKILENHAAHLDTMSVRTSYPESKRMCETLCNAYCAEYGIPAKVVRLTQTFGPGVSYDDKRVFAEFARCAIEKRDIVLHTKGETRRSYLYLVDAVNAILTVLLHGKNGEAYNAANEDTYCSIYEMAELVANKCAGGDIKIDVQIENENKFGYAPALKMNLDVKKLRELGWTATKNLEEMFLTLCDSMAEAVSNGEKRKRI